LINCQSSEEGLDKALSVLFGSGGRIIKWIPKAARAHCAPLLTRLLKATTDNPNSSTAWANLLSFAAKVLGNPARGGKSRNLSNIIIKRCKNFHFVSDDDLRSGSLGFDAQEEVPGRKRGRVRDNTADPEGRLAKLVSVKLEEGNYKGAVRLISSEDTPAPLQRKVYSYYRTNTLLLTVTVRCLKLLQVFHLALSSRQQG